MSTITLYRRDSFHAAIDNKIKTEIVETDCAVPGTTKYRTVPTGGYGTSSEI
jgi:hypothetical protein